MNINHLRANGGWIRYRSLTTNQIVYAFHCRISATYNTLQVVAPVKCIVKSKTNAYSSQLQHTVYRITKSGETSKRSLSLGSWYIYNTEQEAKEAFNFLVELTAKELEDKKAQIEGFHRKLMTLKQP